MTLVARWVLFSAAVCVAACSSVTPPPPAQAPEVASQPQEPAAKPSRESPPAAVARNEQASPPAPTPRPPQPAAVPKTPVAPRPPPVAQAAAPKAAPLDLKKLEERLKDTNAIGVLTKLSLKNQVDDLIARFRAYHGGARPPTLADLRPGFELLLMKVLSLLQDKDAALARDINASREAIWSVLADKQKFAEFS